MQLIEIFEGFQANIHTVINPLTPAWYPLKALKGHAYLRTIVSEI